MSELRTLVFTPAASDAAVVNELLSAAGIACHRPASIAALCADIREGAGAVLLSDEALTDPNIDELADALDTQPGWSEIPVLLMTTGKRGGSSLDMLGKLEVLRTVTLLERPLRAPAVTSAVQAALRGRRRQYELRDTLVDLHRARGEAERANLLKDEFLATLSHELRTPLNAILGWVSMLRQGHIAPEQMPRVLQMVERNAQAQAQLITDVLDVSRIVSGKLQLHVTPVPLAQVVRAAVDTIRPAAVAKSIELVCTAGDERAAVNADPERLQQAFWNLLSNAVRFTPRGGRVSISVRRAGSCLDVTIADTGIGMTPEFLPFAFDQFRQGDQSFSRAQGGLGLGLSIVKHVVQLHGGEVTATSDGVNRGAVFTVRLPVAGVMASREPTDHRLDDLLAREHAELTGCTILVVEDDAATRDMLLTMFDRCGARALGAASARAAIQQFDQEVPSVVLADIGMPGEDGLSLVRRIRDRSPDRGGAVPVVALSAHTRAEDRRAALAAGFDEFVTKPAAPATVIEAVERSLR